jgi:transcription termination/antitermination protein NusA
MFDLKIINSVIDQLEEERGIPREKTLEAIESSLATAYKKEYGKRGQIVRAKFDIASGKTEFYQVKIVVDESMVKMEDEDESTEEAAEKTEDEGAAVDERVRFNPEHHILLEDAVKMKKDAKLDDELVFPLEEKEDFGRIAAQTAKQIIMQKIREAEKVSVLDEFGQRQGEIVNGTVQRIERGNIFVDFGRATGLLSYDEQIKGEHYKQGERIRAYLSSVEESPRGVFLRLSRAHPKFLEKLFEIETPELTNKTVEIKAVAREAGSRSKIAIASNDEHIDPVGSLVGQRGVRVSTVMSELGGEKIDVIEWSEDPAQFIEDSLSPAAVLNVEMNEDEKKATVEVSEDQQSLAIGKGGQNVRLAAKLTGWRIDIKSADKPAETEEEKDSSADVPVEEKQDEAPKEEVAESKEEEKK